MYSDAKKFPNSGGYVWLSDDSRNKYVSVFKSSIFETVIQPPSVVLKMVYHYVCQVKIHKSVHCFSVSVGSQKSNNNFFI